jgi:signal peptidase II
MPKTMTLTVQEHKFPGLIWFLGAPVLFCLDQVTKWLVLKNLSQGGVYPLFKSLNITLAYNRGVAFSMFNQQVGWSHLLLTGFISCICLAVAYWLARTPTNDKWSGFSLMLILGGALGNLCDRLVHGSVVDFIDFYIGNWHWYTFNLADSFITIGAVLMIKTILLAPNESER